MNVKKMEQRIDDFFDSPESDQAINKIMKRRIRHNDQLMRFHNKIGHNHYLLNQFISKVIKKYESHSYKNRWLSRGIEPQEQLYWFLLEYAQNFCCIASDEEFERYGNSFMNELYEIGNYYIGRMDGQGSVVHICKEDYSGYLKRVKTKQVFTIKPKKND